MVPSPLSAQVAVKSTTPRHSLTAQQQQQEQKGRSRTSVARARIVVGKQLRLSLTRPVWTSGGAKLRAVKGNESENACCVLLEV